MSDRNPAARAARNSAQMCADSSNTLERSAREIAPLDDEISAALDALATTHMAYAAMFVALADARETAHIMGDTEG